MVIFVFILVIFQTVLTNVTSSAQPILEPVYLLKISVYTDSDWTMVNITGLSPFALNASIVLGKEAPDLKYSSGPGQIHIMKRQFDQSPVRLETWFLTVEGKDEGLVSIEKGAIGKTIIDIDYYAGSWNRLASFTHSGVNPENPAHNTRSFTVDYRPLYSSPSGSATVEPVPSALEKTVFAFYYPWYNNPAGPSTKWFHWNDKVNIAHEPLFGLYDSKDEGVIEAHIRMAKAAGIDGFIVSWWGVSTPEDEALPIILKIADSLNFSITIYYESYRVKNLTADEMIDELSYIIRTYSSNQAFLKVNGVPVIFVFTVGAWNRSPSFWSDVAKGLSVKVGPTYLIGDLGLPPDPKFAEAFDGLHWYGAPDTMMTSQAFDLYEGNMKLGLKDINWDQAISLILQGRSLPLKEKFLAFTVEPGYDHTKIGGTEYLDRRDGQTYEEFWQTALSKNPDGILVCTWNEWHEGSEIEPSIEYGFAYLNLTRRYTSLYKGTAQPVTSPILRIRIDLGNVVRYGMRNATLWVINDSPNIQAIYVNLSNSLSGGLSLTSVHHSAFYSYFGRENARTYNVLIPLLKPGETIPFNITFIASVGKGILSVTATGYSPSGVVTTFSTTREVQVVYDQVVIHLMASNSRVEVGSEAPIIESANYEYDHQPFSGTIHLNDTLTKYSVGTYYYTASSISDDLYGLTSFTSNTVSITFDRIIMNPTMETTAPGNIGVTARLSFESDGRPVDEAAVTVNGVPAAESNPGIFQTTVATWGPLYLLNVTIERPGFSPQNITLSGYATGNILLVIVAMMLVIATFIVMKVTRKPSVPPPPPPPQEGQSLQPPTPPPPPQ